MWGGGLMVWREVPEYLVRVPVRMDPLEPVESLVEAIERARLEAIMGARRRISRIFLDETSCFDPISADAHRVAAIADEELAAWDGFLEGLKRK